MRGGGDPMVEIIYAQHALKGTEPDWGAMGASDIGFAAGMCKQVGEQVKNVIEFPFVVVDGLFIKLPIALVHGLVQLAEDPQGTVEGLVEKIKVLPAYIEQVPAEFKAYIDEISAIEDPYKQGEALGQLMGDALPTGAVVGGVMGKVVGKVGKWKVTKAAKAAKVEGGVAKASQQVPKGMTTSTIKQFKAPKEWVSKAAKNRKGTKYVNPRSSMDYIRFSEANLHSDAPSGQRIPYFQRHKDGKVLTKSGQWVRPNTVDPSEYHIPQSIFSEMQHFLDL